jgi:hypothetical protein
MRLYTGSAWVAAYVSGGDYVLKANNLSDLTDKPTALVNLGERTGATGSVKVAAGTTAQRDGTPAAGFFRFNSSTTQFEGYNGSLWGAVGGGATGGGGDQVFYENALTVTTNYTLTTSKNAMSTGPISINSGVTVTIPSGARWVVL